MQRVLVAWSMAWEPAREASGSNWQTPYLELLQDDPYSAIKYVSNRSLERLRDNPQPSNVEPLTQRADLKHLLFRPDGTLDKKSVKRLLKKRDNSIITIFE